MPLPDVTLLTLWIRKKLRRVTKGAEPLKVFPVSDSVKKRWRECLAVGLEQEDKGGIVLVVNCHTIDGQGHRKIPSHRDRFTTAALQGSVQAAMDYRAITATQAAKIRNFVVMGDFNMTKKNAVAALRFMPDKSLPMRVRGRALGMVWEAMQPVLAAKLAELD